MIQRIVRTIVFGTLVGIVAVSSVQAKTLEELLKDTELDFIKNSDGSYKIVVTQDGESTVIGARIESFGEQTGEGMELVYLWCIVEKDRKNASPALLRKIAELNDNMTVGKIGLNAESGSIFYNSSFWLAIADKKTMAMEVAIAHFMRMKLKEIFSTYDRE